MLYIVNFISINSNYLTNMKRNTKNESKPNTKASTKVSTKLSTKASKDVLTPRITELIDFNYPKAPTRPNNAVILEGKFKRKVSQQPRSTERKIFNKIKRLELPNSKRTLIPEMNPQPKITKPNRTCNNSFRFNTESPQFNYISKVDTKIPNKKANPKLFKSSILYNCPQEENITKREYKPTLFEKYTTTTQIYNLPGGVKRIGTELNDDVNKCRSFYDNKSKESYRKKVINNYNSNISCLPGSEINNVSYSYRRYNGKKNEGNELFSKENENYMNNINVSKKKRIVLNPNVLYDAKYFGKNVTEKGRKPGYYNESHFQLC